MKKNKGFTLISKACKGFTLIELLVVIGIFATVMVITTQALVVTLRNSRKSDSVVDVRKDLNFIIDKIERNLRNAETIDTCNPLNPNYIEFTDFDGNTSYIECAPLFGWVRLNNEDLSSSNISVTECVITCTTSSTAPTSINVSLTGVSNDTVGVEAANVNVTTVVQLRVY